MDSEVCHAEIAYTVQLDEHGNEYRIRAEFRLLDGRLKNFQFKISPTQDDLANYISQEKDSR